MQVSGVTSLPSSPERSSRRGLRVPQKQQIYGLSASQGVISI